MRTAFFCLFLLAAPGMLAQSTVLLPASPEAGLTPQTLAPNAQSWWAQQPGGQWSGPLLAQNRSFEFAIPRPQAPAGKMEPIPTQWPKAKFEGIPTRWAGVTIVPLGGAEAPATPPTGTAAFLVQPGRK